VSGPRWALLVTKGPDAGSCLAVGAGVSRVGRSSDNHLALSDKGISRAHLEVTASSEGVTVRSVGAATFLRAGVDTTDAALRLGDVIVMSNTALTVIADQRSSEQPHDRPTADRDSRRGGELTDVRTLLGGRLAADVRGFASIAALVESLDAAASVESVAAAVASWARARGEASAVSLLGLGEIVAPSPFAQLAEEPWAIVEVAEPAGGALAGLSVFGGSVLVFHLPTPPPKITDEVRRFLAVAARITSSALAHLSARDALADDVISLRTLALGSARGFLGESPAARKVARLIPKLAASDSSALIVGESGTGKSFLARLVHEASPRAHLPLRVLNCAAIPENLLESELFGHERGAFTGAAAARAGAFEAVGRGTLLLDEIGELALTSQAKLLRVLEERRFERVGSNRSLPLEARVLAATNRDLVAMVEQGTFRRDLFFRISVVTVVVPPLRERGDDVIALAGRLLADLAATAGRRVTGFSPAAVQALKNHAFTGNVRELRNVIEHAVVLGEDAVIQATDFPDSFAASAGNVAAGSSADAFVRLPARLDWLEARAIEAAVKASGGNQKQAAALLGINRVTLYKKLKTEPPGKR
jgi:DNA-binding NtrC family response regulator